MRLYRNSLVRLSCVALGLLLGGCGTTSVARLSSPSAPSGTVAVQAIPEASAFKVIEGKVIRILPDDNQGLPHQNFVVNTLGPEAGQTVSVNHNTMHGTRIKNLKVGQMLIIRGVMYRNKKRGLGIHWTHKANVAGDAGYIRTADGVIYQ